MQQLSWNRSVRVLWGGRFLTSAGLTGISPFIPYYMESLHAGSPSQVLMWTGLAVSAPAVSYALLTPLWGKLGDRWSRKWMVVRALLGLALSMFLMSIAATPFQFFLFRLCQGAFGGISDASSAFIGTHAPSKKQGLALGQMERASAAGLLVGPLLGGICVNTWGSGPLLFITASLTALFAIIAAFVLPGSAQEKPKTAITPSKRSGIFAAFAALLKHPVARSFIAAGILFKLADFATFTIFTPYMRELLDSPAKAATAVGLLIAASSAGELVGGPWWGKRNDNHQPARNFTAAGLLCALCIIAQTLPFGVIWLFIVRFLQGFFYSALLQTVMLSVLKTSSDHDRGVRIGATNSLLMAGQISGPTIGVFIGAQLGLSSVFLVMGGFMLLASMLVWFPAAHTRKQKHFSAQ
ncbi:MFS transporter [Paenibacillus algorifonticola]|uniref:MFS transporter n=1 Tax=Paenibacillus algorifonticola TaxID=684063 RepID=UPI003D2B50E9